MDIYQKLIIGGAIVSALYIYFTAAGIIFARAIMAIYRWCAPEEHVKLIRHVKAEITKLKRPSLWVRRLRHFLGCYVPPIVVIVAAVMYGGAISYAFSLLTVGVVVYTHRSGKKVMASVNAAEEPTAEELEADKKKREALAAQSNINASVEDMLITKIKERFDLVVSREDVIRVLRFAHDHKEAADWFANKYNVTQKTGMMVSMMCTHPEADMILAVIAAKDKSAEVDGLVS